MYLTALRDSDMQVEVTPIPPRRMPLWITCRTRNARRCREHRAAPVPEEGAEVAPDAENLDDTGDTPAEDAAAEG